MTQRQIPHSSDLLFLPTVGTYKNKEKFTKLKNMPQFEQNYLVETVDYFLNTRTNT